MTTEEAITYDVLQRLKLFPISEIRCKKYYNTDFVVCDGVLSEESASKYNLDKGQCIELEPICQKENDKLFVVELKICKNHVYVISPYYFVSKVIEVKDKVRN